MPKPYHNLNGDPCPCRLCSEMRSRRATRRCAIAGYCLFVALGALAVSQDNAKSAIVLGIGAVAMLVISVAVAMLEDA